jgi:hypothetical protein
MFFVICEILHDLFLAVIESFDGEMGEDEHALPST